MSKPDFRKYHRWVMWSLAACLAVPAFTGYSGNSTVSGALEQAALPCVRLLIDNDWHFIKGDPPNSKTSLF
jgi:hypothetical protein